MIGGLGEGRERRWRGWGGGIEGRGASLEVGGGVLRCVLGRRYSLRALEKWRKAVQELME